MPLQVLPVPPAQLCVQHHWFLQRCARAIWLLQPAELHTSQRYETELNLAYCSLHSQSGTAAGETMPKNGTLRKKKRLKARRGMDRATGVADEGSDGTRPPRNALARGPTFADAPIPRGAAGTKRPADEDARERLREERRQRKRAKRRGEAPPPPGSVAAAAAAAALPDELAPAWTGDAPAKRTLGGGIVIEDTALGEGRDARHASSVDVAYEAFVLRDDGAVRGAAIDRATARDPYGFVVGSGDVIRGLSEGVKGMRPGGRRLIEVPWQYAYGAKGRPPKVPPKSRLRFDVQLLEVGAGFVS